MLALLLWDLRTLIISIIWFFRFNTNTDVVFSFTFITRVIAQSTRRSQVSFMKTKKTQAISFQNCSFMLKITDLETPPRRVIYWIAKKHIFCLFFLVILLTSKGRLCKSIIMITFNTFCIEMSNVLSPRFQFLNVLTDQTKSHTSFSNFLEIRSLK